jgi:hypothetical protein
MLLLPKVYVWFWHVGIGIQAWAEKEYIGSQPPKQFSPIPQVLYWEQQGASSGHEGRPTPQACWALATAAITAIVTTVFFIILIRWLNDRLEIYKRLNQRVLTKELRKEALNKTNNKQKKRENWLSRCLVRGKSLINLKPFLLFWAAVSPRAKVEKKSFATNVNKQIKVQQTWNSTRNVGTIWIKLYTYQNLTDRGLQPTNNKKVGICFSGGLNSYLYFSWISTVPTQDAQKIYPDMEGGRCAPDRHCGTGGGVYP